MRVPLFVIRSVGRRSRCKGKNDAKPGGKGVELRCSHSESLLDTERISASDAVSTCAFAPSALLAGA